MDEAVDCFHRRRDALAPCWLRLRARITGCAIRLAWGAALAVPALACAAATPTKPADFSGLLVEADKSRTSDHARFVEIVGQLAAQRDQLSDQQRNYLRYLEAYQISYSGDFEAAIEPFSAIIRESDDPTLQFRAGITLTNILALSAHYEQAYTRLNELLELQPKVPDQATRLQAFGIAALLYNQAGQYDLALSNADQWIASDLDGTAACKGGVQKVEALYRTGKLEVDSPVIQHGLDGCARIKDPVFANEIRGFLAHVLMDKGRNADAIKLLGDHYEEAQRTKYTRLTSEVDSILAKACLDNGDTALAKSYAQSAVAKAVRNETTKPLVDAFQILYLLAKREGDVQNALAYHEKYAEVDKGYLTDTSARTLAFQMVQQQLQDKKHQIDALSERNQVLQLQQEVAAKSAETQRLYVVLLLGALAAIGVWAWRTKRSQMKFQTLSRRDGLTGIINRQHFMDEAKVSLQYCAKSARSACLILIDLDYFKTINDTHGHVAGDAVLKLTVASSLAHMRSIDLFGRLGGEEFGVFLPDTDLETAAGHAERLRAAIERIEHAGVQFPVSASFGVTSTRESGYDLRQMLIHADSALYRAKHLGRNRVELAIHAMDIAKAAHA